MPLKLNTIIFMGIVFWGIFIFMYQYGFSLDKYLLMGLVITAGTYGYYFFVLSQRKKKLGNLEKDILDKLPLGIVVIDKKNEVVWCNPKFKDVSGRRGFLSGKLSQYLPSLHFRKQTLFREFLNQEIAIKDKVYQATLLPMEQGLKMVFLKDITEQTVFVEKDQVQTTVIGIIQVDNYVEVLDSIEEEIRPLFLAELDKLIGDWAIERDAFIRKLAEDKYLVFLTLDALNLEKESKFAILDKIRRIHGGKIPVTLSMGFGVDEESLIDLGRLAFLSLELALGRGGDQVVVKSPERVQFYGGKTQALEKKTKVKTRVIAHSLKDMILEAANVIIMGHREADFDSLGAALGLASAVKKMGVIPFIVVEENNRTLKRLLKVFQKDKLIGNLVSPGELVKTLETKNSLLIIVDTHKPSMIPDRDLLTAIKRIVVIDHHRRSEEFIENANLVYLEPYASSVSELITEIIQYLGEEVQIDSLAATALLAGITVDTKNFIFQTGVRTFEAASYLRRLGGDPILVQKLLKADFDNIRRKAAIIENCQILKDQVALSYYSEPIEEAQVLAAQGADALLNIEGIEVSFVICPLLTGGVTISARSTGKNNVQFLMEKLGGGGHLTVAGAQLPNNTLAEAKEILTNLIKENCEEVKKQ